MDINVTLAELRGALRDYYAGHSETHEAAKIIADRANDIDEWMSRGGFPPATWQREETVDTWADGFGAWHARVTFPLAGYDQAYLEANNARIRRKAQQAIRREICARQWERHFTCRVRVKESVLDSQNVMRSITYAETTD